MNIPTNSPHPQTQEPAGFPWSQQELNLFLAFFCLGFVAKGLGLVRSFATDDYWFAHSSVISHREFFFSQGRILAWLVLSAIEKIGVNIVDTGFVFGIIAIAAQSAFTVYALRFIGIQRSLTAFLCGALIVLHPYGVEIFTYKISLPVFALCMILVVAALEVSRTRAFSIRSFVTVNVLISLALLTYQVAINYLLAVALCGVLAALLMKPAGRFHSRKHLFASLCLLCSIFTSSLFHVFILRIARILGIVQNPSPRSMLIRSTDIPDRANQIIDALRDQYINSEPVFHSPLKRILLAVLSLIIVLIFTRLCKIYGLQKALVVGVAGLTVFMLASIGVTLLFRVWYPTPRVLAHSSVISGLLLLICFNHAMPDRLHAITERLLISGCILLIVGYSLIGNQVIADQIRINSWDAMLANRIIGRIEALSDSSELSRVVIYGGVRTYPRELKTSYFDINISAFYRVSLQRFAEATIGESTGTAFSILQKPPPTDGTCQAWWPQKRSVWLEDRTAYVCLSK